MWLIVIGSDIADVVSGSTCDFHGEIGYATSALTPWEALAAPANQEEAKKLPLDTLYSKKPPAPSQLANPSLTQSGASATFVKRDSVPTNIADIANSPLYHENEPWMQVPGDPYVRNFTSGLAQRDGNSLVDEPRSVSGTCKVSRMFPLLGQGASY